MTIDTFSELRVCHTIRTLSLFPSAFIAILAIVSAFWDKTLNFCDESPRG